MAGFYPENMVRLWGKWEYLPWMEVKWFLLNMII